MTAPPDDIDLHAAIAALRAERDAALARETALAEVIAAINRSPGDPGPVFQTILQKAHSLCGATIGSLGTYDGMYLRNVAAHGYPPDSPTMVTGAPFRPTAGASQRLINGERLIHYTDVAAMPPETLSNFRDVIERLGVRTVLLIPLRKDGAYVGGISALRTEAKPFTDTEISLLESFAAQAVIAMENARLITEQREALEQQTATAEVLQVINASPGDLTPVFDAMLEKALRLSGSAFGLLRDFDGKQVRTIATRGLPEALAVFSGQTPLTPEPGGALDVALKTGQPAEDLDLRETGVYKSGIPGPRAMVDLGGARTVLQVPLVKDRNSVGLFTFYRQEVRSFSPKEIALLENFAAQAVIAMENARLLTEQQEALERQTAMAEVLAVINANPGELGPVFDMILEKAHRLCDIGMGALLTCEAGQRRAVVTRGYSPEADAHARRLRPIPDNLAALAKSEAVLHDPDVSRADGPLSGDFGRTFVALTGARTYLVVPLSKEGTLLGTITAVRREVRPFTERQITLLKNFADQAVIAMENARLITEQREALEQQTATAEVLQVINASPGNLAPVFDAMLEKAMRLCEAQFGVLSTYDGKRFRIVAAHGIPADRVQPELSVAYPEGMVPVPGSALERVANGDRVVHILDLVDTDAYRQGVAWRLSIVETTGARTALWVALRKDDALLGVFVIYRQEVRAFTGRQIALLENFAAQAVIAMENARLLTEQREALEQQTATAEVLAVINASPGNLAPVFETLLERAMRLCQASFGVLGIFDGERMKPTMSRGVPSAYSDYFVNNSLSDAPETIVGRLLRGANVVHVPDLMAETAYRNGNPDRRALVELGGARTSLSVALVKEETLLGQITIYRQEVRAFSNKQIALLENFAAQAVIAMENARLITEQREALEQQTATAEVLQVINAFPGDLGPVFDTMIEKAMRLCGAAFGTFYTYDGEQFLFAAQRGVPEAFAEFRRQTPLKPVPGSPLARSIENRQALQVLDLKASDLYLEGNPSVRAMVDLGGMRTILTVPLCKDEAVLGFFSVYRQEVRAFSGKQIALLENFAAQAVIAMENARLLNELRARTDELAQRQAELRITFENMGDGVAMFDETQHLVAWNRKFQDILDVPDEALAARPTFVEYIRYLTERGEFGQGAEQEEQLRRIQATRGRATAFERTRPSGRVIEVRQNPVPGGRFVLIYADITERKRNEAEIRAARDAAEEASRTIEAAYRDLKAAQANLIQAEKMASLGQLTAGIAHEIKNPLNFVNNFSALSTELIDELRDVLAPEPLGETARTEVDDLTALLKGNLEKVVQHGQRADGIVRSMLDHSRGSSGERRMVDLNALIDEALNLAYHGARAQDQSFNITLERDFGEGAAPIEVNPQDITRVFLNIFANGFYAVTKRARDGGDAGFVPKLKATTRDAGDAVEIRVRDNGTGIPADIRDKLFQPFFTTKPTGEGTGLGLSITYDIVTQQHGGSIAVASNVGEYSEFTIRLPRIP